MKNKILLFCVFIFISKSLTAVNPIIPAPFSVLERGGNFIITEKTTIGFDGEPDALLPLAEYLQAMLKEVMVKTPGIIRSNRLPLDAILFIVRSTDSLPDEGYLLSISDRGIIISAKKPAGIFYAIQTLRQLLPIPGTTKAQQIVLPQLEILDMPRFSWRGMHLDVVRHFMPVDFIKKYIDYLAMHKMNIFHWHLTDDQGWRIEIKKYPRLTEVGAWRKETLVGHYADKNATYDSTPHGGFYTQDEIKDIVEYARQRFVTIIPEIEMPGHAQAAIAAYPFLGCVDTVPAVRTTWGISKTIFNVEDTTFKFLENVLTEVMALFPSEYIHIGGDEAVKDQWIASARIQQKIKKLGLKDEHELQSYFIKRIEKFVNANGRKIIGWDEIMEGGLAPNAAVMVWRGGNAPFKAARDKHPVVMCPGSHCYFDMYQGFTLNEPLAIGGYTPTEKVYSFDPIPDYFPEELTKYIIGAQGNVWTEYIASPWQVEYMVFPRMAALSEVLWSPKDNRNWDGFVPRLEVLMQRYKAMGINYRAKGICR